MAFRFSSLLGRATGASVLLHASALGAMLLLLRRPSPAPGGAMIELRLVETQGVEQASQPVAPQNPSPNPLPQGLSSGRPSAGPVGEGAVLLPLPLREGAGGRGQLPQSEFNLSGDSLTNALAAGSAVVPARVDARWHNREPVYPPGAARRGEAGTVLLLVHVGPDGAVAGIDIAESSGFPRLDDAARAAVETWHFLPAVRDGQPLASDMPLRVVFQLN